MPGGWVRIAGETYAIGRARFEAYHCAGDVADWNLALERDGATLWLSGTISPAPRTPADLHGAQVRVDLRSLDDAAGALLGRAITMYPGGASVCALTFALTATPAGVSFAATFPFTWDRWLETFPGQEEPLEATFALEAEVGALHPGRGGA